MSSVEQAAYDADYEQFMQELEGDREMRSKLNLYKRTDTKAKRAEMEVEGGESLSFCFSQFHGLAMFGCCPAGYLRTAV